MSHLPENVQTDVSLQVYVWMVNFGLALHLGGRGLGWWLWQRDDHNHGQSDDHHDGQANNHHDGQVDHSHLDFKTIMMGEMSMMTVNLMSHDCDHHDDNSFWWCPNLRRFVRVGWANLEREGEHSVTVKSLHIITIKKIKKTQAPRQDKWSAWSSASRQHQGIQFYMSWAAPTRLNPDN